MENYTLPNDNGYYGIYGGRFVPETLMTAVFELEQAYQESQQDQGFQQELEYYLRQYVGRESILYYAKKLTNLCSGPKIYLKREDLNHTGAHKINNTIGQALLTIRMGKKKLVAETGAGQHGVATATAAALFGLECVVFMGEEDIKRQELNVFRMKLLGAKVVPVTSGSKTLKDACNEALRYWVANVRDTHYIIGSVVGPHPFPKIVRDFQSVIGKETKRQYLQAEAKLPDAVVACVGGGSNAMGMFYPFIEEHQVALYGVEAEGKGIETGFHAASNKEGRVGVLHGSKMNLLQDNHGQIKEAYSISAGLDYPGVGPEHCYLQAIDRVKYCTVTDEEALQAFQTLSQVEGIIPALESAHAVAYGIKLARTMNKEQGIVICLSGRGDKDVQTVSKILEVD